MAITKFKGTAVALANGVTYIIPALSLRQVQALQDRLAAYTGAVDAESIELVLDTVQAALSRNYPELSRDAIADMVDLGNMSEIMQAVMGASGMVDVAPGEAKAMGSTG